MPDFTVLERFELTPVVELDPYEFAGGNRQSPSGNSDVEEWSRFWFDSLADSGIVGLLPIRIGSWHAPIRSFDRSNLQLFLEKTFEAWGGVEYLSDPESSPVLNGGLVLRCADPELSIEPGCCSDLGNLSDWKAAAAFRAEGWQMLWIGHPWMSVCYQAPHLILSEQHESNHPVGRWSVDPDAFTVAIRRAEDVLEEFAGQIAEVLVQFKILGVTEQISRKLVGLPD